MFSVYNPYIIILNKKIIKKILKHLGSKNALTNAANSCYILRCTEKTSVTLPFHRFSHDTLRCQVIFRTIILINWLYLPLNGSQAFFFSLHFTVRFLYTSSHFIKVLFFLLLLYFTIQVQDLPL